MGTRSTLADVAAMAGVSAPTVSKVLNDRDDVAPATRDRVRAAVDALEYRTPGRRRAHAARPLVDFACERIDSEYAIEVLRGVLDHAADVGVDVVVSQSAPAAADAAARRAWPRRLSETGRAGAILVTSALEAADLEAFAAERVPTVVIDPLSPVGGDAVSVGATNWSGGRAATDHLLDLGHRRIAYIGGPAGAECSIARLNGYLAALRGRGIELDDRLLAEGSFRHEFGVEAAARLLDEPEPPTAIFAANEAIAAGAIEEAGRRGIPVPERLSVVGFDGTRIGESTVPALTTVAQPLHEMGRTALRLILRQADEGIERSRHIELATELVVRRSTAAAPA